MAQQRLVLEQTRDQTRANVVTAWGQLVAGRAQVASAQSQVTASAVGRLSPQVLKLATTVYDPSVHYQQVRDSWYGVRIPDGR